MRWDGESHVLLFSPFVGEVHNGGIQKKKRDQYNLWCRKRTWTHNYLFVPDGNMFSGKEQKRLKIYGRYRIHTLRGIIGRHGDNRNYAVEKKTVYDVR